MSRSLWVRVKHFLCRVLQRMATLLTRKEFLKHGPATLFLNENGGLRVHWYQDLRVVEDVSSALHLDQVWPSCGPLGPS